MKMTKEQFEVTKRWMLRNARPIDLARWKFHFENGSKEDVLGALAAYQNADGGFAHALEADCWNPNSTPIQTWCATEILFELGVTDRENEIVKGILSYLESKADFQSGYWFAEVPSNNDFPHAQWWTYGGNVINEWGYNPTVCLVGFILYFADRQSAIYKTAVRIAKAAFKDFLHGERRDMHELQCFIRCYDYSEMAGITELFDTAKVLACLKSKVKVLISEDKESWEKSYLCKPSQFMITPESHFYADNQELSDYEVTFILDALRPDGTWTIPWNWDEYPEEWAVSKNWWKAIRTLTNLRYLKGFGCLPI